MITPQKIYEALEARRTELGLSQAEVGARAFGKADNSAFQALRRGSSPAAEKLEALCAAVGWELYFGPPRDDGPVQTVSVADDEFARVPAYAAQVAAGCGAPNEKEEVVGHLAFRRAWLKQIGTAPSNAVLVRAQGESMSPTVQHNDMLLIDRAKSEIPVRPVSGKSRRRPSIYALLHEGLARVKRIERPEEGLMILTSDNPDYAPEILIGDKISSINIIGRVMWWGHTERE